MSLEVARPCIIDWYRQDPLRWQIVCRLNHEQGDISIRLLDWLVTTYARDHPIVYQVDGRAFSMHRDYRTALRAAFSKISFDPFRRRVSEEIWFTGTEVVPRETPGAERTTLGQLAFFRWAITRGVYAYTLANRVHLEEAMIQDNATRKRRGGRAQGGKKKKSPAAGYAQPAAEEDLEEENDEDEEEDDDDDDDEQKADSQPPSHRLASYHVGGVVPSFGSPAAAAGSL